MPLSTFLDEASTGRHPLCRDCPWNPGTTGVAMAFGRSCLEHGVDWADGARAVSMQVVQDPGGTTPASTGKLCFACNSRNPTDKTAQHNYDLWRAAVALRWERPALEDLESDGYRHLRRHYWANAVMHGAPDGPLRLRLRDAARQCNRVIEEQIRLLRPRVLVASGSVAAQTLRELGYVSATWEEIRGGFDRGPFESTPSDELPESPERPVAFCTYHTSSRAVNTAVARLYDPRRTEYLIEDAIAGLENADAAHAFLDHYGNTDNVTHRGMRVLLLHWLSIGRRIREVSAANGSSVGRPTEGETQQTKAEAHPVERFIPSPLFREALTYCLDLHGCDVRKGKALTYIAHLLGVCALVLEAGGDQDQAIAALLHDALEDHPESTSAEEIERRFGAGVARIVRACTDTPPDYRGGEKAPWLQRKEAYLAHISKVPPEAIPVSLADKLHNAREILADYRSCGEALWERFNAPKERQLWFYRSLVRAFRDAGAEGQLVEELDRVVTELERLAGGT